MTLRDLTVETWLATAHPRRALPIAAVAVPLWVAQAFWNADPVDGVLAGVVLTAGAVLIAPATFRACVAWRPGAHGVARYVAISLVVATLLAIWLPRIGGFEDVFLAEPVTLPFVIGIYLVAGWGLGRDITADLALKAANVRAAALERARDHAELLAVRSHLDPHFLFNTLNAIAEWCATDPAVAEQAILRLAGVLRTVLTAIGSPSWPLAQELALVTDVLALYRVRDPQRFDSSVVIDGVPGDVDVPALLLLPVVENAFFHGPAAGHAGQIVVHVTVTAATIRVDVDNPGPLGDPREGSHGLAFVTRRLAQVYGDRASFALTGDETHTRATLLLPTTTSPG